LTKKQGKKGEFLELSIKNGDAYDKYVCFLSQKKDKFGNEQFTIYEKTKNDLPF